MIMETPKKKRGRPRKKEIRDFEVTHEANIIKHNPDGSFVTDEFVSIPYIAKLKIAGKEYHAEGLTLEDTILNLKPLVKKGVGILTVKHGEKEIQKILSGPMTFKLFNVVSRLTREIAIKNLKTLFTI